MYLCGMDAVVQALSDDNRRSILETLRHGPATVNEIAGNLAIARPGVSRHLRILREAGLVRVRKDAQRRIYAIDPEPLEELDEWLEPYRALWAGRFAALHTEVARGKRLRAATEKEEEQ
jgi:DNA-binding transcriptional ArsR family regulator